MTEVTSTFLGATESGSSDKHWLTTITLNKTKVTFKLDTGVDNIFINIPKTWKGIITGANKNPPWCSQLSPLSDWTIHWKSHL